jgi:hypothetical protein
MKKGLQKGLLNDHSACNYTLADGSLKSKGYQFDYCENAAMFLLAPVANFLVMLFF